MGMLKMIVALPLLLLAAGEEYTVTVTIDGMS